MPGYTLSQPAFEERMLHIYPTKEHPAGAQDAPWFILIADLIFPSDHHPSGSQGFPWFKREGNLIYSAYGHPELGEDDGPQFVIRGEHLYHLETDTPWFRTAPVRSVTAEKARFDGLATKLGQRDP